LKLLTATGIAGVAFLLMAASVFAAYTLFGDAEIVSPGADDSPNAVQADGMSVGSGISFTVPANMTFADLEELSTDYRFVSGDCMAGSPRFQVRVQSPDTTTTGNIMVYIGPPPNYDNCPTPDDVNTGDLLESGMTIDTTQIGGTFYHDYDDAVDDFGDYVVLRVSLVVDPTYGQVLSFDNIVVGDDEYDFDQPIDDDQCKKGGWEDLTREDGTEFKNQGDCIQYVNTGR